MEIAGYLALVGVGIMLGITGGGGSILSVPILVYLFSLDVVMASAYSLFVVGITSMVGTVLKQKESLVDVGAGLTFAVPSIIAAFSTRKWVVGAIPDLILHVGTFQLTKRGLLLGILAFVIIVVSVRTILNGRTSGGIRGPLKTNVLIPMGLITGVLAGLLGVGGGFLILPALVVFARIPFESAVGTTLFVIALNSLLGFLGDLLNYAINWTFLLSITALSIAGVCLGILSNKIVPAQPLQKSLGWITLTLGIWILVNELL
ncbi:MAG TPA: sulfite exporter TauE/SafE family protein [Cyclobacteriaceae bacterium]|jgi:hypothetical protein